MSFPIWPPVYLCAARCERESWSSWFFVSVTVKGLLCSRLSIQPHTGSRGIFRSSHPLPLSLVFLWISFPHITLSFHIPILRHLKNNPHPSALIFYTSPSTKLSHPGEESLPHSLLTILCNTFRPSCPFQHLSPPPCCCHTNPWPFLFALFCHGPHCLSKKEKVGRDGRQKEKKTGGGQRG